MSTPQPLARLSPQQTSLRDFFTSQPRAVGVGNGGYCVRADASSWLPPAAPPPAYPVQTRTERRTVTHADGRVEVSETVTVTPVIVATSAHKRGRDATSGVHETEERNAAGTASTRRSFTYFEKYRIVRRVAGSTIRKVALESKLKEETVREWWDRRAEIATAVAIGYGKLMKMQPLRTNAELCEHWFRRYVAIRDLGFPITTRMICHWGDLYSEQFKELSDDTKTDIVKRFRRHYHLSMRKVTGYTQIVPEKAELLIAQFHGLIQTLHAEKKFRFVAVADETFCLQEPVCKTVAATGARKVLFHVNNEKAGCTVMLAAIVDLTQPKPKTFLQRPFIIFKGKERKHIETDLRNRFSEHQCEVRCTESGWMTADIYLDWLSCCLPKLALHESGLLIVDMYAAHRTEAAGNKANSLRWQRAFIPGGCTSLLQPHDLACNRGFKSGVVHLVNELREHEQAAVCPTRAKICSIIHKAYMTVKIQNSLHDAIMGKIVAPMSAVAETPLTGTELEELELLDDAAGQLEVGELADQLVDALGFEVDEEGEEGENVSPLEQEMTALASPGTMMSGKCLAHLTKLASPFPNNYQVLDPMEAEVKIFGKLNKERFTLPQVCLLVPVNYAKHWALFVYWATLKTAELWDSYNSFATEARAKKFQQFVEWLQRQSAIVKEQRSRQSLQQPAESNDCGFFVINNIIKVCFNVHGKLERKQVEEGNFVFR